MFLALVSWLCFGPTPQKITRGKTGTCWKNCAGPWHIILWPGKWLASHVWSRSTNDVMFHLAWSAILHKCLTEKQWEKKLPSFPFIRCEPFNILYSLYNHTLHSKGHGSDNLDLFFQHWCWYSVSSPLQLCLCLSTVPPQSHVGGIADEPPYILNPGTIWRSVASFRCQPFIQLCT
jgi:hypothetical protein